MMRPPLEMLLSPNAGMELIYSFVIILCSLMIYHSTKEVYKLSSYKGLKYFRQAFLFFAVAYFFRYSIKFLLIFFDVKRVMDFSPILIGVISLSVFLYSSSMAVFYLLYSIMWKKWNSHKINIWLFNIFAIIIAFIGTLFINSGVPVILNLILLVSVASVLFSNYHHSKKKGNLFIIYILLLLFWVLNIISILIPDFLEFYQLLIYLVSISLFMVILYKVLKKIGN